MKMRKYTYPLVLILCSFLMAGCGFQPRSGKRLPNSLRQVYYAPENPDSITSVQLKAMLAAMNVHFVKSPKLAKYTLHISNNRFSSSRAEITNANLPSSISYDLTAAVSIENNKTKHVLVSNFFVANQSITLNANQIYMPNTNYAIKQTLSNEIQAQIYYWLTTTNIKKILDYASN